MVVLYFVCVLKSGNVNFLQTHFVDGAESEFIVSNKNGCARCDVLCVPGARIMCLYHGRRSAPLTKKDFLYRENGCAAKTIFGSAMMRNFLYASAPRLQRKRIYCTFAR